LSGRFSCIPWFNFSAEQQEAWLAGNSTHVRGIATGGHLGCSKELADRLPNLGIIAINGVGFDKVDLSYAKSRGIAVTTTPGILTEDVADLAVGLMIGLLRELPASDLYVRRGEWESGEKPPARKVSGRHFGVVGLGQIGMAVAARLAPFGPVSYFDVVTRDVPYGFVTDVIELARAVDVLVLTCAATPENRGFIGQTIFEALGPTGYVVNVARGSIVDQPALISALERGTIAGAALDVFADEPHVPVELRNCSHTHLTPHIASATVETRTAMADLVLGNLTAFALGEDLPSALSLA
jgi:lactate dehydrogenase-like 2-hydroxyacid dehydrogenase